ncbi:MAG: FAD-dependent oxidoreductase [Nakamurella sp.]
MADQRTFVIVGAGLAGARAAQILREDGFDGHIILVGDEPVRPYDRVTLSKHYLYRTPGFHGLYLHDDAYYGANDIELKVGTSVAKIDVGRGDVVLASGKRLRYDALLLTTGAEPNKWTGRGADLNGVHYLRTLADADQLRTAFDSVAKADGSVVVVGTGWVGLEVAAAARELGIAVDLVGRSTVPLERQVGSEMGRFFRDLHLEHDVTLHFGTDVAALSGAGSVEEVVLADGSVLPADLVVFGIGASPRTGLAASAGLTIDDGIVTDEYFRTSIPNIYAAGDCAMVRNMALESPHGRHSRLGHFSAAFAQGPGAARSMLGNGRPYSQVPFFFSDQYDMWMEFTGDATAADQLVVRTLPGAETFIAFWLRNGRLAAGMNVNIKGVPDTIRELIEAAQPIDPAKLADPTIPLAATGLHA